MTRFKSPDVVVFLHTPNRTISVNIKLGALFTDNDVVIVEDSVAYVHVFDGYYIETTLVGAERQERRYDVPLYRKCGNRFRRSLNVYGIIVAKDREPLT